MGLQFPEKFNLACAAKGPINARPGKKPPQPKPSRSAKLIKMLGPPLHLAPSSSSQPCQSAAIGSAEPAVSGSVEPAASGNSIAQSQGTVTDSQQDVNDSKCIARTWAKGVGAQCSNPRKSGEYCGRHATNEKRPHGRIDEEVPPQKKTEFQKKGRVLTENNSSGLLSGGRDEQVRVPAATHTRLPSQVGKFFPDEGASSTSGAATRHRISEATCFRQDMCKALKESVVMGAEEVIRRSIEDDDEQKVVCFLCVIACISMVGGRWSRKKV